MPIFSEIGQVYQYDTARASAFLTYVLFEFRALKIVYMQFFCQIGQEDQYDTPRGRHPFDHPQGATNVFLQKINVIFEIGTLKLVYIEIFSQTSAHC